MFLPNDAAANFLERSTRSYRLKIFAKVTINDVPEKPVL